MKKFTIYIQLLLTLFVFQSLDAQRITVEGPELVCQAPYEATYVAEIDEPWLCQYHGRELWLQGTGTIISAIDDSGNNLAFTPFFQAIGVVAWDNSNSVTVTVQWNPGCNQVTGIIFDSALCTAREATIETQVGTHGTSQIIDLEMTTGSPAIPCSDIEFCAEIVPFPGGDCEIESYVWNIKGTTIHSSEPCITYSLESCPLGNVEVKAFNACGEVSRFNRAFSCTGPPSIVYPKEICGYKKVLPGAKRPRYRICAPGVISGIKNLAANPANSVSTTHVAGSKCFEFFAPSNCPTTINFSISFVWCGRTITQNISIKVKCCDFDILHRSREQNIEDEVLIKPNPAIDFITLDNSYAYESYTIFTMGGEYVSAGKLNFEVETIDINLLKDGQYIIVLKKADELKTEKFIKQ